MRTKPKGGSTQESSGFGDLTVRVKVNFWGNDGGQTAFGMMPFIKFPTNQNNLGNNSIEGGIIFPFAISLSDKWDVGMQTEFDLNKNEDASGYNVGFVNTVSFGYKINNKLSTYFELFTETTTERSSQFVATFDTGLKYLLTENVQLDAGINIGLTEAADEGRVPPVDGNVQFSSTRWRLVRQTFILNIPPNSNPLAQIIIATPSTVAVSNDIDVLDRKGRKININVSVNGKNIILAFPEPVAPSTKLVINLNKVEQSIGGPTSVYRFSAKVVGSDEEIPAGVAQFRP